MSGVEALVVERMTKFVHQSQNSPKNITRIKTEYDADIAGTDNGRKRILSKVETSALEIESDRSCNAVTEQSLALNRESICTERRRRQRWPATMRFYQWDDTITKFDEQCCEVIACHTRL